MLGTILALLAFAFPAGPLRDRLGAHARGDEVTRTLEVGGRPRSYLVHLPRGYDGKPHPVVLILHGGMSNAAATVRFTGLDDESDRAGFIAVYPNGTGRRERMLTWNAGDCCGAAVRERVDDVAFVRALLDDLAARYAIDPKRVYATGISNGGMMAYRLAAELSDRIAAIASVSGPIGVDDVHPTRPVAILHFHGTADEFAPFAGGRGRKSLASLRFHSVAESIAAWVRADRCAATPVHATVPSVAGDPTRVRTESYAPCADGTEVFLYVIEGGGHAWPGRQPRVGFLGASTTSVSANERMWEFFARHARR